MSRSSALGLSGLQPLEGDRAHHGVVGAELGRGDVQLEAALRAAAASRSRSSRLAATPPPTHSVWQLRSVQRQQRLGDQESTTAA